MGAWPLTGLLGTGMYKGRVWVYPIPAGTVLPEGGTEMIAGALRPEVALGDFDANLWQGGHAVSREAFRVGPIETVGDPVHGWLPITLDTDTRVWRSDWNAPAPPDSSARFHLGLRVCNTAAGSPRANPCDFLLAFDYVLWNGGGVMGPEHAGMALPVDTTARSYAPEFAGVSGFQCGDRWSISLAGEVPEDAWDQTDLRRPPPVPMVTLLSSTGYLEVVPNLVTREVVFRLGTGESLSLGAPPPARFFFLRASPVLIGVSCVEGGYLCAVSVGGTTTIGKVLPSTRVFGPTQILFSDHNRLGVCPMLWYGGRIDEHTSCASFNETMQNLDMLFEHRH
jgi:hypothetical protein